MAPREHRRNAYQRGYTKRWGRMSKRWLQRHPCCGERADGQRHVEHSACARNEGPEDTPTPATVTDHIVPHRGDERLFNDEANWQSLCARCHNAKSNSERFIDANEQSVILD